MTPSEIAEWHRGIADFTDCVKRRDFHRQAAATIRELEATGNRTAYDLDQVSAAIGTVRFMDPPDGGSVTLAEQVAGMHDALNAAEAKLKIATEALERIVASCPAVCELSAASAMADDATQALARIKEVG